MDTGARGWQMIFRHQASSINVNHCWCSRKTNQATCGSCFAPNPKSSPCQISMLRDFATLEQQCTKMWGCHRKRRREAARKGKQTAKNSSCLTGWKENVSCFFLFLFVLGAKKRIFWEIHSFCSRTFGFARVGWSMKRVMVRVLLTKLLGRWLVFYTKLGWGQSTPPWCWEEHLFSTITPLIFNWCFQRLKK